MRQSRTGRWKIAAGLALLLVLLAWLALLLAGWLSKTPDRMARTEAAVPGQVLFTARYAQYGAVTVSWEEEANAVYLTCFTLRPLFGLDGLPRAYGSPGCARVSLDDLSQVTYQPDPQRSLSALEEVMCSEYRLEDGDGQLYLLDVMAPYTQDGASLFRHLKLGVADPGLPLVLDSGSQQALCGETLVFCTWQDEKGPEPLLPSPAP